MGQAVHLAKKRRRKWEELLLQWWVASKTLLRRSGQKLHTALAGAWRKCRPWAEDSGRCLLCAAAAAVVLPGNIAPFGLALCIAVPQSSAFLCSIGCALGGFAALPAALAIGQASGALLTGALRLVLGRKNAFWCGVAGTAVTAMLSQTAAVMGQPQAGVLRWLVQGSLVLALALLYMEVRPGSWLAERPRAQLVRLAVWIGVGCALAVHSPLWLMCAVGLAGLVLGALERTARLPLVWCAAAVSCLLVRADPVPLLIAVGGAWLAGRFSAHRGGMAAIWCCAAAAMGILRAENLSGLGGILLAAGGTAAVFCLLPERLLLRLDDRLALSDGQEQDAPVRTLQTLAGGLRAIGNGVEALGRACTPPPEAPDTPIETVCRQVCSACTQKARCWGAGYDDTVNAMRNFLESWRADCRAEFAPWFVCTRQSAVRTALLRAENLRILRRAGQAEAGVLRSTVSDQYRALADGLYRMAQTWQPEIPQPRLSARLTALIGAMQLPVRELQACRSADGALSVIIRLRGARLSEAAAQELTAAVSRCCGTAMRLQTVAAAEGQELLFAPQPVCGVETGVAQRACRGICGDVTEVLEYGGDHCLLLCDGMGTGAEAAADAKMTALFAARLLRAGFDADVTARLVNAALLTRTPGDRGSTLDLLRIRGADGQAFLYKAGACPGYLVRAGRIRRLGGEGAAGDLGLPLGSAGAVRDHRQELALQPDDLLVMASDGALACGEAAFTRAVLALQPDTAPRMAAVLLAACASARPEDDSTVLLVRITRAADGTVQDRQTER